MADYFVQCGMRVLLEVPPRSFIKPKSLWLHLIVIFFNPFESDFFSDFRKNDFYVNNNNTIYTNRLISI